MQLCGFESAQMMKEGLLELGLFLSLLSIFFTSLVFLYIIPLFDCLVLYTNAT